MFEICEILHNLYMNRLTNASISEMDSNNWMEFEFKQFIVTIFTTFI